MELEAGYPPSTSRSPERLFPFLEVPNMSTNPSTGPRTDAGKAVSSMNSLKHGLTAKTVVLPGENKADFDALHQQLLDEHAPVGALETELVAEIAACLWRLQRARRYESKVLETSSFEVFVSHKLGKGFETLLRYMGAIERQLNRAIVRLRETQSARRKLEASRPRALAATASPIVISHSPQFVSSARPAPPCPPFEPGNPPLTTVPDQLTSPAEP
jgi:hypothetical protein